MTIGLIAGAGSLPREIAAAQRGRVFVLGLKGSAGDWITDYPHEIIGLGQVGRALSALRDAGCGQVVFAGGLSRPDLSSLRFDATGLRKLPRFAPLMRQGDDALLRGLAAMFEDEGFEVIGAAGLLADALAGAGPMTRRRPGAQDEADIARGAALLASLAPHDVGQALVVANGLVLGIEAIEGTAALLARIASLPRARRTAAKPPCGVLVKAPKTGQDRRFDLPAVGPETIDQAAEAGLNGLALAAGGVFVLERAETLRRAARHRLFIHGFTS